MKDSCGVVTVRSEGESRRWKNVFPTIFQSWISNHMTGYYWDITDKKTGMVMQRSIEIKGNPLMVKFLYFVTEDWFLKNGHWDVLTKNE